MRTTQLFFATSNLHKVEEARKTLDPHGITVQWEKTSLEEIQSESLEKIAVHSLKRGRFKPWTIVEDTGLFIEALNGFPGPYAAYVLKTIGNEGILTLMQHENHRNAYFKAVIALLLPDGSIKLFEGKTEGFIATEIRDPEKGWGFDPIFIPREGNGMTYSELGEKKNELSHRARAFKQLAQWLQNDSK